MELLHLPTDFSHLGCSLLRIIFNDGTLLCSVVFIGLKRPHSQSSSLWKNKIVLEVLISFVLAWWLITWNVDVGIIFEMNTGILLPLHVTVRGNGQGGQSNLFWVKYGWCCSSHGPANTLLYAYIKQIKVTIHDCWLTRRLNITTAYPFSIYHQNQMVFLTEQLTNLTLDRHSKLSCYPGCNAMRVVYPWILYYEGQGGRIQEGRFIVEPSHRDVHFTSRVLNWTSWASSEPFLGVAVCTDFLLCLWFQQQWVESLENRNCDTWSGMRFIVQ